MTASKPRLGLGLGLATALLLSCSESDPKEVRVLVDFFGDGAYQAVTLTVTAEGATSVTKEYRSAFFDETHAHRAEVWVVPSGGGATVGASVREHSCFVGGATNTHIDLQPEDMPAPARLTVRRLNNCGAGRFDAGGTGGAGGADAGATGGASGTGGTG